MFSFEFISLMSGNEYQVHCMEGLVAGRKFPGEVEMVEKKKFSK